MEELVIKIDWLPFLGIIGTLITLAWIGGGKFSRIEALIDAIEKRLTGLEGRLSGAFQSASPVSLTVFGERLLNDSGLKNYIDTNKQRLFLECRTSYKLDAAYDVQNAAFKYFDGLVFDEATENMLKEFAYQQGVDMSVLRRVGGIYFRNILLKELGMEEKDIDKQKPQ